MERQTKFVAFFNRKSYGAHGLPLWNTITYFWCTSIVNEKPSASNKTKKLVSRSKFCDFEHFQNIVFQKQFLVAGFKFIFTRSVVIGYICQDFLLK